MMQHISKTEIAERLDEVLGAEVGMQGLNTLLYGMTRKDPQRRTNISHRRWLFGYEVLELSTYAGYNLFDRKPSSAEAAPSNSMEGRSGNCDSIYEGE